MDFLDCRMYGHHWDSKVIEWDTKYWYDHLECDVCGTKRSDTIRKRNGQTKRRSYKYPEGYMKKPGEKRLKRSELKKEVFENA